MIWAPMSSSGTTPVHTCAYITCAQQFGPTKSRPDGTVRSRLDAARSRPYTARNSTVERSERNKSHTNYMLTTCSVPLFCRVQDEHGKK